MEIEKFEKLLDFDKELLEVEKKEKKELNKIEKIIIPERVLLENVEQGVRDKEEDFWFEF